jgi:hypothetical protein
MNPKIQEQADRQGNENDTNSPGRPNRDRGRDFPAYGTPTDVPPGERKQARIPTDNGRRKMDE